MAKTDTVITGPRSISGTTVNADDLRRPQPRIAYADSEPRTPYPTRFQSLASHYIVTLNIRTKQLDSTMKDNKFNVMFVSGFLDITRHPYPFDTERVSAALCACNTYGIGKAFWDSDEFAARAKRVEVEAFQAQAAKMAQTPDGRVALKAVLGDSFNLPPAPPSAE